jgi:hypothetical protein
MIISHIKKFYVASFYDGDFLHWVIFYPGLFNLGSILRWVQNFYVESFYVRDILHRVFYVGPCYGHSTYVK